MATVACACVVAVVLSSDVLVPFMSAEVAGRPQTLFTDHDVMVAAGAQARLGHLERAYHFDWMTHAAPSLGAPTGRWSPYTYPPTAALVAALPTLAGFLVTQTIGLVTFFSGIVRLAAPERRHCCRAASASACAKAVAIRAETIWRPLLPAWASAFLMKCTRQRWAVAPSTFVAAAFGPSCASESTS